MKDHSMFLKVVSKVLIRCFFMNIAVAFLWWFFYIITRKCPRTLIFDLSEKEYSLSTYCGIGLLKLYNIIFFLFPYIAIKKVLKL